jgi:hypothetical protein
MLGHQILSAARAYGPGETAALLCKEYSFTSCRFSAA